MPAYLTQSLRRAAQTTGSGIATLDGDRRRNWRELLDRVARMAGVLAALGVKPGDRVGLLALNSDRYFELQYAVPWAGGVLVPLNTRLAAAELRMMLEDAAVGVLFVDDVNEALVLALDDTLGAVPVVSLSDRPPPDRLHYETLLAQARPIGDVGRSGADLAALCFTGGSTGRPKGVMLSHDNLVANAMNTLMAVGYDASSVYLHAAPMFHLADAMANYALSMAGGTHAFIPRFDARACLMAMVRHQVTHIALVPTMIEMLVRAAEVERFDLSALRQIQFGASPMPDATLQRLIALWPDIRLVHGWGMTELSPNGAMLPMEWRDPKTAGDRLRSCGKAVYSLELRIVDEHDHEVRPGSVGEIVARGPSVTAGYWHMPEETARVLRNGWLHTGDAAYMDDEGFIYIVDRLKDMIISGGENVYSTEVENVISQIPGVAAVAIVGTPDETWGEIVHAIVICESGVELDTQAIIDYCRQHIAGYKCPRRVSFREDPLPLTGAGKVFKRRLREEYSNPPPAVATP